jgi:hypothetical protein
MRIKVSPDEAERLLEGLENKAFQGALPNHWKVYNDGHVCATSVLWLFCWAKTGMGSAKAEKAARELFDRIMEKSFIYCNARIPHKELAKKYRYSKDEQDVEDKLAERL